MVMWSTTAKLAYVVELLVPWEDGVEEAYERKMTKYSEMATEAAQNDWMIKIFPVEVGCSNQVLIKFFSTAAKKQQLDLD